MIQEGGGKRWCLAKASCALAFLFFFAVPLQAWGPIGHRVVGEIAQRHLSEPAAAAVTDLLEAQSLAQVSTWADEIGADTNWTFTKPWHFINLEEGATLGSVKRVPEGDIMSALQQLDRTLGHSEDSREKRADALKLLVHLIGDLHQPLHVGSLHDHGGNDIKVFWFGVPSNLHRVWDSGLIDIQKLSYTELVEFIHHVDDENIRQWQGSNYEDWMKESLALRTLVLDIGDGNLGYPYVYRHKNLVEQRLLQAGIRLAGVLNRIFATPPAVQPAESPKLSQPSSKRNHP